MNATQEEARELLAEIREVQARTRRALGRGAGPYYMMIWGTVWFLGYLGSQFLSFETAGLVWTALVIPGMIASALVGGRVTLRFRGATYDARIGLFWLALLAHAALIILMAGIAEEPVLMSYVVALFAMLGYVVMGLWLWTPLAWVGLSVTAIGTVSYLLMPGYFCLIMALLGGGTLFLSGFYVLRAWR